MAADEIHAFPKIIQLFFMKHNWKYIFAIVFSIMYILDSKIFGNPWDYLFIFLLLLKLM